MEGAVDRVSLRRRPSSAASPAVEQLTDVVEVPAENLLEGLDSVAAHVEDLLVDAEGELRVSVAEQVHRAARGDAALGEDRRERTPQRMRRAVACGKRGAARPGRLGTSRARARARLEENLAQGGDHRDDPLAGEGLRLW